MDKDYNFNLKINSNDQALEITTLKLAQLKGKMKLTNKEIQIHTLEYKKQQLEAKKLNMIKDQELKKLKEIEFAERKRLAIIKKQEVAAARAHNKRISELKQVDRQARKLDMRYLSIMFTSQMISRAILGFSRNALDTFKKVTDSTSGFNRQLTKAAGVWEYFKFSFANAVLAPVLIPLIDIFQSIVEAVDAYGQEHPKMMALIGGLVLLAGVSTTLISIFTPLIMAANAISSMKVSADVAATLAALTGAAPKASLWSKFLGVIGTTSTSGLIGALALFTIGIGALEGAWDLIMPLLSEGFDLFKEIFNLFGGSILLNALGAIAGVLMDVGAVLGITLVTMIRGLMNSIRVLVAVAALGLEKIKVTMGLGDVSRVLELEDKVAGLQANAALIGEEGAQALANYNAKTETTINNNLTQNMSFSDANISRGISTANEGAAWFAAQPQ